MIRPEVLEFGKELKRAIVFENILNPHNNTALITISFCIKGSKNYIFAYTICSNLYFYILYFREAVETKNSGYNEFGSKGGGCQTGITV